MSAMPLPARRTPVFNGAIRAAGFAGLGIVAILVGLNDVIARAPADATGQGAPLAAPSLQFPCGTDLLGRDVASETLHALAITAGEAVVAMAVALLAGALFGFLAARLFRPAAAASRWIAGILSAAPAIFLAILFVGLTARDLLPLAAGLAASPPIFVRAFNRARQLNRSRHAEYARASGIGGMALLRRDLAYEIRDDILSLAARALAAVTITVSTVSFFGFGAVPPGRDLGLMIAAARASYAAAWWTAAFPALTLVLFIFFARLAAGLEEDERP